MSAFSIGSTAFQADVAKARVDAMVGTMVETLTARSGKSELDPATVEAIRTAGAAPTRDDALSTVIKWVPGEIIGTYAAVVAALQGTSAAGGQGKATGAEGWILVVFMGLALLMSVLGGNLAYRRLESSGKMPTHQRIELFVRGALACLGLLIWSYVIPGTVTNQSDLAKTYEGAASAMVFLVAVVFGLFAEFMVLPATLRGLRRVVRRSINP
jgi:hypothetical protein